MMLHATMLQLVNESSENVVQGVAHFLRFEHRLYFFLPPRMSNFLSGVIFLGTGGNTADCAIEVFERGHYANKRFQSGRGEKMVGNFRTLSERPTIRADLSAIQLVLERPEFWESSLRSGEHTLMRMRQ